MMKVKEVLKEKWMVEFERRVVSIGEKHRGKIEWAEAAFFFNSGKTPSEAAQKYADARKGINQRSS
jgi:hypothetical protein